MKPERGQSLLEALLVTVFLAFVVIGAALALLNLPAGGKGGIINPSDPIRDDNGFIMRIKVKHHQQMKNIE